MGEQMDGLALRDQFNVAKLLGDIQQLIVLDNVWTNYLNTVDTISSDDAEVLDEHVREMRTILERLEEFVPKALEPIANYSVSEFTEGLISDLSPYMEIKGKALDLIRKIEKIETVGDIRTVTEGKFLAEIDNLDKKMNNIWEGKFVKGDMSKNGYCYAGIAATFIAGAAQVHALAGAGFILMVQNCDELAEAIADVFS